MTKVKRYLGKHCLISIYYSLVYSHLMVVHHEEIIMIVTAYSFTK